MRRSGRRWAGCKRGDDARICERDGLRPRQERGQADSQLGQGGVHSVRTCIKLALFAARPLQSIPHFQLRSCSPLPPQPRLVMPERSSASSTPKPATQHKKIAKFNPPVSQTPRGLNKGISQAVQAATESPGGGGDWRGWEVQWRMPQARKNKTWEK